MRWSAADCANLLLVTAPKHVCEAAGGNQHKNLRPTLKGKVSEDQHTTLNADDARKLQRHFVACLFLHTILNCGLYYWINQPCGRNSYNASQHPEQIKSGLKADYNQVSPRASATLISRPFKPVLSNSLGTQLRSHVAEPLWFLIAPYKVGRGKISPIQIGALMCGDRAANPDVLNSWKEIALYLHRGVRTVQRWHLQLQLPVHTLKGTDRSPVFAYKSELDFWLKQRAARESTVPASGLQSASQKHTDSSAATRAHLLTNKMLDLTYSQRMRLDRLTKQLKRLQSLINGHAPTSKEPVRGADVSLRSGAPNSQKLRDGSKSD